MFKLVKIISSGTNVPDPIRLNTTAGVEYRTGCALVLTSGALTNAGPTTKPTHIALESAKADEKSTLLCYAITPGMIFEAPVAGNPGSIKPGFKVNMGTDGAFAYAVGVSQTNGVVTVVNTSGAKRVGDKVLATFD